MTGLSVVIPAYREAENLKSILPRLVRTLKAACSEWEILIVDTMEPTGDGTEEVCLANGATYVNRKGGNLYGDAIRTGFAAARFERICVMDADGSHNPDDITRMIDTANLQNADLVIGSRYTKGGHTENPSVLIAMSYMLNVTYRILFGIKVKDVSDSFRLYDAAKVKSIGLECDNFDIVEEILILLGSRYPNLRIVEIPITFDKRDKGESKRDLKKFVRSYIKTIRKLMRIRIKNRKNRSADTGDNV
ncbi:MAG: glycosyltransferase [Mageeibacillus sp.]|nr:glycosyltransferase [Mageeibacillus sp.]